MLRTNLHDLYRDLLHQSTLARILIAEATSTSLSLLCDLCEDISHPQLPAWRMTRDILCILEIFSQDERCTYPQSHLHCHWKQRLTALHAVAIESINRSIFIDAVYRSQTLLLRADVSIPMRNPITRSHCRLQFHSEPTLRLKLARKILRSVMSRRELVSILNQQDWQFAAQFPEAAQISQRCDPDQHEIPKIESARDDRQEEFRSESNDKR